MADGGKKKRKMRRNVEIKLSSRGLSNIPVELYDHEFQFVAGACVYKCSSIVAEFLSPRIARIRKRAFSSLGLYAQRMPFSEKPHFWHWLWH